MSLADPSTALVAGPGVALDPRQPVRLDGRAGALVIVAGRLHLFLSTPSGRRRPWLTLEAGEAALGLPDAGSKLEVLAVGADNCRIVDVPGDAGLDPAVIADWIRRLRDILPPHPAAEAPETPLEELTRLRRQAGPLLAAGLARAGQSETERLSRQRERAARESGAALGELAGLVRRPRLADRFGGDPATDALSQGCIAVARALAGSSDAVGGVQGVTAAARSLGLRTRAVLLRGDWWTIDTGPLIAWRDQGRSPVAIVRSGWSRREIVDPVTGARAPLSAEAAGALTPEAVSLYRSLPDGAVDLGQLARWLAPLVRRDVGRLCLAAVAIALLALAAPALMGVIVSDAIGAANLNSLSFCAAALLAAALAAAGMQLIQSLAALRIGHAAEATVQAALIDRVLRLPAGFFRTSAVGDFSRRIESVQVIRTVLIARFASGLTALCVCVASFALMARIDAGLMLVALGFTLFQAVVVGALTAQRLRHEQGYFEVQGRTAGLVLQMVTAVGKLRVAGAADRALAQWMARFAEQKRRSIQARRAACALTAFTGAFPLIAILGVYAVASRHLGDAAAVGPLIAFFAAFGQSIAALGLIAVAVGEVSAAIPVVRGVRAILAVPPEPRRPGQALALSGAIEVHQLRFAYPGQVSPVLDGLSFSVRPGEFVALVGPSGCGKSTVFRMLLGFERPEQGSIFYDGRSLDSLDLDAVRGQIGVVLQNGRLRSGSIFENICGALEPPVEQVWEAARRAGMKDEIEALPMGLRTMVQEGASTLSGGQRQRLMIARALLRRPKLLLFDEATSALDNATQAIVAEAIAELDVTRIVIAHRVSTIRHADRILVIERGAVVQAGRFEELTAQPGPFADLVGRQVL